MDERIESRIVRYFREEEKKKRMKREYNLIISNEYQIKLLFIDQIIWLILFKNEQNENNEKIN